MGCHVARIGHIGVNVSNVDRSIEFYRKILGLKLTGKYGPPEFHRPICFMRCEEMHHDFVLFELPEDAVKAGAPVVDSHERLEVGVNHIAFEVAAREDWLDALKHVKDCGVEVAGGPYVHGLEGSQGAFEGGSGSHAFYFLDPDGNRIEIYCWMMKVTRPGTAAPAPDL